MFNPGPQDRVLQLTLSKGPFVATKRGEKDIEVRRHSQWIQSRLIDSKTGNVREYDYISYRNGYKKDSPITICKFGGAFWTTETVTLGPYTNKFKVTVKGGTWVIVNEFSTNQDKRQRQRKKRRRCQSRLE
jgi:hypothetical protein